MRIHLIFHANRLRNLFWRLSNAMYQMRYPGHGVIELPSAEVQSLVILVDMKPLHKRIHKLYMELPGCPSDMEVVIRLQEKIKRVFGFLASSFFMSPEVYLVEFYHGPCIHHQRRDDYLNHVAACGCNTVMFQNTSLNYLTSSQDLLPNTWNFLHAYSNLKRNQCTPQYTRRHDVTKTETAILIIAKWRLTALLIISALIFTLLVTIICCIIGFGRGNKEQASLMAALGQLILCIVPVLRAL